MLTSIIADEPVFKHSPATGETITTYTRTDERRGEMIIVHPHPVYNSCLLIGIATEEECNTEEWHVWAKLTIEEANVLRQFLNRPEVVTLLGEILV